MDCSARTVRERWFLWLVIPLCALIGRVVSAYVCMTRSVLVFGQTFRFSEVTVALISLLPRIGPDVLGFWPVMGGIVIFVICYFAAEELFHYYCPHIHTFLSASYHVTPSLMP